MPRPLILRLARIKRALNIGVGAFDQLAALAIFDDYPRLCQRRRTQANEHMHAIVDALRRELPEWKVPAPQGGWSQWLTPPAGSGAAFAQVWRPGRARVGVGTAVLLRLAGRRGIPDRRSWIARARRGHATDGRRAAAGVRASVCPDGTANLSPKGTVAVWVVRHLVFAHVHSHQTVANIDAGHAVVEVNVVDPIRRKGYRCKCPAEVHRDGERYDAGVRFFERRSGLGEGRIQAIVLVGVERVSALLSPSYDDGSSEEEVEERFLTLDGLRRADRRGQQSAQPR